MNAKSWIAVIAGALVLLIALQNMEPAQFSLLFWTFEPPKALLIFLALVLGAVIGWALSGRRWR